MKKIYIPLVLLGSALLFNSSCTNNKSAAEDTQATQEASVETPGQSAVTDDVSQKDVVKIAIGSQDHTTLVKAVQAAELVDVLSNAGPFTVFAPTNAAFEALPEGTLEELVKPENKGKLTDILQYHVTVSTYDAEKLIDGRTLGQVSGGNITITHKDGKIYVNDAAILASIPASNGIIHVIDKVLLPK